MTNRTIYDDIAHLYATDDDDDLETELPTKAVTLDALHEERGDDVEVLDSHDIDELVILVRNNPTDENMIGLGLALPDPDVEGEIVLLPAGREVLARIIRAEHPELGEGPVS